MNIIEVVLIGIGLAMDAFAVSVCKGLSLKKIKIITNIKISMYFAFFQAIMPIIGYYLGNVFEEVIINIDHWVAFILLSLIGINMIKESISIESENINDKIDIKTMTILALATSIDALAIGITFSFLRTNIYQNILIIGIITFIITFLGVKIGYIFGNKYEKKAQLFGGLILIIIGLKILLEHLQIF